jgi:hypothetical protein
MSLAQNNTFDEVLARLTHYGRSDPQTASTIIQQYIHPSFSLGHEEREVIRELGADLNLAEIRDHVPSLDYLLTHNWFMRDLPLQQKMLRAVRNGLGSRINVRVPDLDNHLDDLLARQNRKFVIMQRFVKNFNYLKTRGWFMRDLDLQEKLFKCVSRGLGKVVNVMDPEFSAHIGNLLRLQDYMFKIMRCVVKKFSYLEKRGWFMHDLELQINLYEVVCAGFGDRVIVDTENFCNHVMSFFDEM